VRERIRVCLLYRERYDLYNRIEEKTKEEEAGKKERMKAQENGG